MNKQINLQDAFLSSVRKQKTSVTIHVTNGYQIKNAQITGYDNYVVIAESNGSQMMVFKHAISTITPESKVSFKNKEEE